MQQKQIKDASLMHVANTGRISNDIQNLKHAENSSYRGISDWADSPHTYITDPVV